MKRRNISKSWTQIHQSARSIVSIARVRASKVARPRFHCPPCSSLSAFSSRRLREDTFPRVFRGRPFSSCPISAEGSIDRNHPRFCEIVRFERGIIRCTWNRIGARSEYFLKMKWFFLEWRKRNQLICYIFYIIFRNNSS